MSTTLFLGKAAVVTGTEIDFKNSTLKMGSTTVATVAQVSTEISTARSAEVSLTTNLASEATTARAAELVIRNKLSALYTFLFASTSLADPYGSDFFEKYLKL